MNVEHLVKMANEIGAFYISESDKKEAAQSIASHLRRYWEPRMRKAIIEHYNQGGAGMKDATRDAVGLLVSM